MGTGLNVVAHTLFAIMPNKTDSVALGIIGYGLVGLAYSFFTSTVWPCIPYLVPKVTLGTAIGIAYCVQACGVSIGSFIVGLISVANKDEDEVINYFWIFVYLSFAASVATICVIILMILDCKQGRILLSSNPKEAKEEYEQKLLATKEDEK